MKWAHRDEFRAAAVLPWHVKGKEAGSSQTAANFTFLRVYDAGHMVPRDQPENALAMVNSFLAGGL
jgi:carboxypeptidase C (cathepsin A)